MVVGNTEAAWELYDSVRPKLGWLLLAGIISVPVVTVIYRELAKPQVELRTGVTALDRRPGQTTIDVDFGLTVELERDLGPGGQHEGPQGPSINRPDVLPGQGGNRGPTVTSQRSLRVTSGISGDPDQTADSGSQTATTQRPIETTTARPTTSKRSTQTTTSKLQTTKPVAQSTKPKSTVPVSTANQTPAETTLRATTPNVTEPEVQIDG